MSRPRPTPTELNNRLTGVERAATEYFEAMTRHPQVEADTMSKFQTFQDLLRSLGMSGKQVVEISDLLFTAAGKGIHINAQRIADLVTGSPAQKEAVRRASINSIMGLIKSEVQELIGHREAIETFEALRTGMEATLQELSYLTGTLSDVDIRTAARTFLPTLSPDVVDALIPHIQALLDDTAGPTVERDVSTILAGTVNTGAQTVPDSVQNAAWPGLRTSVVRLPALEALPPEAAVHFQEFLDGLALQGGAFTQVIPLLEQHFGRNFFTPAEQRLIRDGIRDSVGTQGAINRKQREIYAVVLAAARRNAGLPPPPPPPNNGGGNGGNGGGGNEDEEGNLPELPHLDDAALQGIADRMIELGRTATLSAVLEELFPDEWEALDAPSQQRFVTRTLPRINLILERRGNPQLVAMRTQVEQAVKTIRLRVQAGAALNLDMCVVALHEVFMAHPSSHALTEDIAGHIVTLLGPRHVPVGAAISIDLAEAITNRGLLVSPGVRNSAWNGLMKAAHEAIPDLPTVTPLPEGPLPPLTDEDHQKILNRMIETGRTDNIPGIIQELFHAVWDPLDTPTRNRLVLRTQRSVNLLREKHGNAQFTAMRASIQEVVRTLRQQEHVHAHGHGHEHGVDRDACRAALRTAFQAQPVTEALLERMVRPMFALINLRDADERVGAILSRQFVEAIEQRLLLVSPGVSISPWHGLAAALQLPPERNALWPHNDEGAWTKWNQVIADMEAARWAMPGARGILLARFGENFLSPDDIVNLQKLLPRWRETNGAERVRFEKYARDILHAALARQDEHGHEGGNGGHGNGHGGNGHGAGHAHGGHGDHGHDKPSAFAAPEYKPVIEGTSEAMQEAGISATSRGRFARMFGRNKKKDAHDDGHGHDAKTKDGGHGEKKKDDAPEKRKDEGAADKKKD